MKERYVGSWGSVLWFRVRTDSLEINGRIHHWAGVEDVCGGCDLGVREMLEHVDNNVVMECSGYEEERISLRERIKSRAGVLYIYNIYLILYNIYRVTTQFADKI